MRRRILASYLLLEMSSTPHCRRREQTVANCSDVGSCSDVLAWNAVG